MEKVILTKVFRTDKDKAGTNLINKNGKPYTKCNIQTQQHGERYLSGFGNKTNQNWKIGDEVEIIIKTVFSNGTEYLNYETPKEEDVANAEISKLKTMVGRLNFRVEQLESKVGIKYTTTKEAINQSFKESTGIDYPEQDLDIDNVPF